LEERVKPMQKRLVGTTKFVAVVRRRWCPSIRARNVWDSLAEGYMKAGDVRKAQENYEKALNLDPANQNAKDALKRIKDAELNPKQK
jgi:tetratricopeptide (TPR) repeat protein